MAQKIGLCAIADTATAMGYHNAIPSQSDIHDTMFTPRYWFFERVSS